MFTFRASEIKASTLASHSAIVITHTHPDHLDIDTLKRILAVRQLEVHGNAEVARDLAEVARALAEVGILCKAHGEGEFSLLGFNLQAIEAAHEPILAATLPLMYAYLIEGRVLHVVDSFDEKLLTFASPELLLAPGDGTLSNGKAGRSFYRGDQAQSRLATA